MEEKKRKTLQSVYRAACDNYLHAFAKKHGFDTRDCSWVSDEPGGVASVGDYYIDMQTLKDDIDMDAPEEEFIKWYDYTSECAWLDLPDRCNFRSWVKGCPRYSEETFGRIRALRKNVESAQEMLRKAIEEEKNKF